MWNALCGAVNALYIDPSATSILLASITSIAVAAASVVIILWRKFKRGAKKVLKIDENAGKEVEEDLVILDDTVADENAEKPTEPLNDENPAAPLNDEKNEKPDEKSDEAPAEPLNEERKNC